MLYFSEGPSSEAQVCAQVSRTSKGGSFNKGLIWNMYVTTKNNTNVHSFQVANINKLIYFTQSTVMVVRGQTQRGEECCMSSSECSDDLGWWCWFLLWIKGLSAGTLQFTSNTVSHYLTNAIQLRAKEAHIVTLPLDRQIDMTLMLSASLLGAVAHDEHWCGHDL